jgi:hypothetical protein
MIAAGAVPGKKVDLVFGVIETGDEGFDSAFLIDNVKVIRISGQVGSH